jgi:hypothetical protein
VTVVECGHDCFPNLTCSRGLHHVVHDIHILAFKVVPICLYLLTAPWHGTSVLTGLRLGVGKEPLAEIENRQRARDTGRSAGGNDGKVPVEHDD